MLELRICRVNRDRNIMRRPVELSKSQPIRPGVQRTGVDLGFQAGLFSSILALRKFEAKILDINILGPSGFQQPDFVHKFEIRIRQLDTHNAASLDQVILRFWGYVCPCEITEGMEVRSA